MATVTDSKSQNDKNLPNLTIDHQDLVWLNLRIKTLEPNHRKYIVYQLMIFKKMQVQGFYSNGGLCKK